MLPFSALRRWGTLPLLSTALVLSLGTAIGPSLPSLSSPSGSLTTRLTHVVYTRDASEVARIYINGVAEAEGTVSGSFSNWDESFRLALANELTGNRPWLGEFHRVAVYNQALSESQVIQNFNAGPGQMQLRPAIWLPSIVKS